MTPSHPSQTSPQRHTHKWWILIAIGVSLFMGSVDGSIVNVALPTLATEMGAHFATIQWVALSFLLVLTVLMLSMGRLGDMVGKKAVFVTGLVVFTVGSLLCGLAPGIYWLIAFRAVQAMGAAMMLALGIAIITETWPAHERGAAIGISGGIISLGIVAGPALGGWILQALNWRWIFFVNLPVGVVALGMVMYFVPALRSGRPTERFDYPGATLIGVCMLSFSLAMTLGQTRGFGSVLVLGMLGMAVAALLAFVRVEQRSAQPMIDLSLFRNMSFSLNLFTGFLTFVAISGVVLLLPFYLQLVLNMPQRNVGLLMAVVPLVLGVLGPISGILSDRFGTRPVSIVGLALIVTGYLGLTRLATASTPLQFVLLLLPVGLGMGTFQSPNNAAIMGVAPRNRLGVASGVLSMTRTLGQTIGIAVLGAFFTSRLHALAGPATDVQSASSEIIVRALHSQLYLTAILIGIGLLIALWQWRVDWETRKSVDR